MDKRPEGASKGKDKKIIVIDQTIREGMQHRGIVFSTNQRKKILQFQEILGVDICQAGYPPAHVSEEENIRYLQNIVQKKDYKIRIAALARAYIKDVDSLIATGIKDFHLHAHIKPGAPEKEKKHQLAGIRETIEVLRDRQSNAVISLAMLDIGTTDAVFLKETTAFLMENINIDILSLPDTSGIMAPVKLYEKIKPIAHMAGDFSTKISVHCHNDLGLASANTLAGVSAGAEVIEVSVLGIGERNGIADIFTVGKILKDQGYETRLKTDETEGFKAYYKYVSNICLAQTGEALLSYNTPFFGNGVKTHVAGTHAGSTFGISEEEDFYLNLLCGRHLVKKYLESRHIAFRPDQLNAVTEKIKSTSAELGRSLKAHEIQDIVKITRTFFRG